MMRNNQCLLVKSAGNVHTNTSEFYWWHYYFMASQKPSLLGKQPQYQMTGRKKESSAQCY